MKSRTTKTASTGKKSDGETRVDPRFAPVVKAFAKDRRVSYGKMFASMGLKVNGKIFAMLVKEKFVAKLPKTRVDELVILGEGEPFDPGNGRLMKEWIAIRGAPEAWPGLAREAHRFVLAGKA